MNNNHSFGVSLQKAVYALKCPVCGAECRSKENGECPYCGAYLDFGDFNSQPLQNAGVSMQTYDAPPIQPYPQYQQPYAYQQPQFTISPEGAQRTLDSWKKARFAAYLIYCVIAVVSIFGGTVLNEGDRFYDLVMGICVLGYFPLSVFLPIVFAATRRRLYTGARTARAKEQGVRLAALRHSGVRANVRTHGIGHAYLLTKESKYAHKNV